MNPPKSNNKNRIVVIQHACKVMYLGNITNLLNIIHCRFFVCYFVVSEIEPRGSYILGMSCSIEPHLWLINFLFRRFWAICSSAVGWGLATPSSVRRVSSLVFKGPKYPGLMPNFLYAVHMLNQLSYSRHSLHPIITMP